MRPSKQFDKRLHQLRKLSFEAIGTFWQIETPEELPAKTLLELFSMIQAFDSKWSRFRSDSLVSECSRRVGNIPLDRDEYDMFQLYKQLYDASQGAITPLIGQTLEDMGYDARYSLQPKVNIEKASSWHAQLALHPKHLELKAPTLIDIGAAGKGLLVDRISTLLKKDTPKYSIDAGGDIFVGAAAKRIGLEDPQDHTRAIGVVTLEDQALCGSSSNRRTWSDNLHHIVDARDNTPVSRVIASWAVAPSAMQADMASTALFFISPPIVESIIQKCESIVMYDDGKLQYAVSKEIKLYV